MGSAKLGLGWAWRAEAGWARVGGLAGLAGRAGRNGLDGLDSLAGRAGLGRSWAYLVFPLAASVFGKIVGRFISFLLDIWFILQNASRRH